MPNPTVGRIYVGDRTYTSILSHNGCMVGTTCMLLAPDPMIPTDAPFRSISGS
jgi:hypothetical protein